MVRPLRNAQVEIAGQGDMLRAVGRVDSGRGEITAAARDLGQQVGRTFDAVAKKREEEGLALDAVERARRLGEYRARTAQQIGELDPTKPDYEASVRRILDEGALPLRQETQFNSRQGELQFNLGLAELQGSLMAQALAGRRSEAQRLSRIEMDNAQAEAVARIAADPTAYERELASLNAKVAGMASVLPEAERVRIGNRFAIAATSARALAFVDRGDIASAKRVIDEAGRTGLEPTVLARFRAEVRAQAAEARVAQVQRQAAERNVFLIGLAEGRPEALALHAERLQNRWYDTQPDGAALRNQAQQIVQQRTADASRQAAADLDIMTKFLTGERLSEREATRAAELHGRAALDQAGPNADQNPAATERIALLAAIETARQAGALPRQLAAQWAAAENTRDPAQLARSAQQLRDVETTSAGQDATKRFGRDSVLRQVLEVARDYAGGQTPSDAAIARAAEAISTIPPSDREARTRDFRDWLKEDANRATLNADLTEALGPRAAGDPAWRAEYEALVRANVAVTGDIATARRAAQQQLQRTAPRTFIGTADPEGEVPRHRAPYETALGQEVQQALGFVGTGTANVENRRIYGEAMTRQLRRVLVERGALAEGHTGRLELRPAPGQRDRYEIWAETAAGLMAQVPGDESGPRTVLAPRTLAEFDAYWPGLRQGVQEAERRRELERRNPVARDERAAREARIRSLESELKLFERRPPAEGTPAARRVQELRQELERLRQ